MNEEQKSAQKQNNSQMEKIEEVPDYNLQDDTDYVSGNPFAAAMADEGDYYKLENNDDDN